MSSRRREDALSHRKETHAKAQRTNEFLRLHNRHVVYCKFIVY